MQIPLLLLVNKIIYLNSFIITTLTLFCTSKDKEETLILWRNDPCVVIGRNVYNNLPSNILIMKAYSPYSGRHQNPWVEANLPFIRANNINIARYTVLHITYMLTDTAAVM